MEMIPKEENIKQRRRLADGYMRRLVFVAKLDCGLNLSHQDFETNPDWRARCFLALS